MRAPHTHYLSFFLLMVAGDNLVLHVYVVPEHCTRDILRMEINRARDNVNRRSSDASHFSLFFFFFFLLPPGPQGPDLNPRTRRYVLSFPSLFLALSLALSSSPPSPLSSLYIRVSLSLALSSYLSSSFPPSLLLSLAAESQVYTRGDFTRQRGQ